MEFYFAKRNEIYDRENIWHGMNFALFFLVCYEITETLIQPGLINDVEEVVCISQSRNL